MRAGLEKKNRKEMVYDAILEGIFAGEYAPNQILNEQALTEKFGCSKSPVREAPDYPVQRGRAEKPAPLWL